MCAKTLQVEEQLALFVLNDEHFRVQLPELGIFKPNYYIDPTDLQEGEFVGHIVAIGAPVLIISRITEVEYATEECEAIKWPQYIVCEPIQHYWDNRPLRDLAVSEFSLKLETIQCIFIKP